MAWNKHASSRNRPKIGYFGGKYRRRCSGTTPDVTTSILKLASFRLRQGSNKQTERKYVLMKTADTMVDFVRTHKNAFRLADQRVSKVQQSRYERRKIRAYLRLGDWLAEA